MKLKIKTGTVPYNNKILVSNGKFSLRKNDEVNASLTKPEKKTTTKGSQKLTTIHKVVTQKPVITHEEERAALILFLTGGFTILFVSMNRKFCVPRYTRSHATYVIVYVPINFSL